MKILIIDNYDSFVYNLFHAFKELGIENVEVFRNDEIEKEEVAKYDRIVLSPGPGIPDEAGKMKELIKTYRYEKPILGVCLGHQGIGEVFGLKLKNLDTVYHGIATPIAILEKQDPLFQHIKEPLEVGRYHSWVVENKNTEKDFKILATDEEGEIMAMRHRTYPIVGVQFHPESILTPQGNTILENWIKSK